MIEDSNIEKTIVSGVAAQAPGAELLKLGGARVILATVTKGEAMAAVLGGLASTEN